MKGWVCFLTRRHKWSHEVSATSEFQRIDCLRCGMAIDGARVRVILAALPPNHWMRDRLPKVQS